METENKTKELVQAEAENEPETKKQRVFSLLLVLQGAEGDTEKGESRDEKDEGIQNPSRSRKEKSYNNEEGEEPSGNTLHRQIEARVGPETDKRTMASKPKSVQDPSKDQVKLQNIEFQEGWIKIARRRVVFRQKVSLTAWSMACQRTE